MKHETIQQPECPPDEPFVTWAQLEQRRRECVLEHHERVRASERILDRQLEALEHSYWSRFDARFGSMFKREAA